MSLTSLQNTVYFLIFWWRKIGSLLNIGMVFWQDFFLLTVGNKPLQRVKKQQNLHHQKKKCEINQMLSSIYQTFKPFISFLDIVFLLHICNMLCIAPSYLSPAVHHLSRLLGDIYNEVIFTGHPLLLFTTPLGHNGHLSVNELLLSFFSFFFQSTVSLFPAA